MANSKRYLDKKGRPQERQKHEHTLAVLHETTNRERVISRKPSGEWTDICPNCYSIKGG